MLPVGLQACSAVMVRLKPQLFALVFNGVWSLRSLIRTLKNGICLIYGVWFFFPFQILRFF